MGLGKRFYYAFKGYFNDTVPKCLQIIYFLVNLTMSAVREHLAFYPGTISRPFKRAICPENAKIQTVQQYVRGQKKTG